MPRKAPKEVIEHRITLGNYEREKLNEIIDTYQANSALGGISNLLGSIGWPLLGVAGLIYVGFSFDEFIEDTKTWAKKQGDSLAGWLEKNGLVNYTADEIGRAIQENDQKIAELVGEMGANVQKYCDPNSPNFSATECKRINQEMDRLQKRDKVLRKMLQQIVDKDVDPMGASWIIWTGASDGESHENILTNWYKYRYRQDYGESADDVPDWDIQV